MAAKYAQIFIVLAIGALALLPHGHALAAAVLGLDLLTIRDLMQLTRESESAWRKRLGRREIPFVRLGTNVRVRREDLDRWLLKRTVSARDRAS